MRCWFFMFFFVSLSFSLGVFSFHHSGEIKIQQLFLEVLYEYCRWEKATEVKIYYIDNYRKADKNAKENIPRKPQVEKEPWLDLQAMSEMAMLSRDLFSLPLQCI